MDFNDNPFYLLKAKTTDDKKKLLKLAEESLINNDSSKINSARLILSNPKKRIYPIPTNHRFTWEITYSTISKMVWSSIEGRYFRA